MPITKQDLQDFHRFADAKLNNGGAQSLSDLVREWEATRQAPQDAIDDIRASHIDIEAGRVVPVSESFAAVREELGLE